MVDIRHSPSAPLSLHTPDRPPKVRPDGPEAPKLQAAPSIWSPIESIPQADHKMIKSRRRVVKNAGRYLLYGEELSREAAISRGNDSLFMEDVTRWLHNHAQKKGFSDPVDVLVSAVHVRMPGFAEHAQNIVTETDPAGPPPKMMVN